MSSKIWAAIVAGGLLVGAGFVTSVVSAPATATAQEVNEDSERGVIPRVLGFLDSVLDELVGDGTIDQGQADAHQDHRCDGDEHPAVLRLDPDVAGEISEPAEESRSEPNEDTDHQEEGSRQHEDVAYPHGGRRMATPLRHGEA